MMIRVTTLEPSYESARDAVTYYSARAEVDGPLTLDACSMICEKFRYEAKVPGDATLFWSVPYIYAGWKR